MQRLHMNFMLLGRRILKNSLVGYLYFFLVILFVKAFCPCQNNYSYLQYMFVLCWNHFPTYSYLIAFLLFDLISYKKIIK